MCGGVMRMPEQAGLEVGLVVSRLVEGDQDNVRNRLLSSQREMRVVGFQVELVKKCVLLSRRAATALTSAIAATIAQRRHRVPMLTCILLR
jgi:hypothetical protein